MELIIIIFLIIISGIFAMTEIAIISSRKSKLKQMAEKGDIDARKALELANNPNRFLSTVQIGITFVGIFAGAFFASFWLLSRGKWMGLGDAKLAVGLGWLLGGAQMISAVILSFWTGAVFGIFLVLFKKYGMKSEVPFAPFLVLGAVLAFLFELHVFPTL